MSKKNKWFYHFPKFDIADRFTYFNDLSDHSNDDYILIAMIKQKLYNAATTGITSASSFLNSDVSSEEILSAVSFLEQVAANEREKELSILRTYKEQLRHSLPKNKNIDDILNKLDTANLDDLESLDNFYKDLTDCINVLRKTTKDYLERLKQIKITHKNKTMSELMKDDMRFRGFGDVHAMLTNLTGMATQAQNKNNTAYAAILRQITGRLLQKYNVVQHIKNGEDFAAIAAALLLDISTAFQEEVNKRGLNDFTELLEDNQIIQQIIQDYENRTYDQESRLQQALNGNYLDLENIIYAAKQTLGISSISAKTTATEKRHTAQQRSKRLKKNESLYRTFKKDLPQDIFDELPLITFNSQNNQSHGNLFELLSVLWGKGSKVSGGAAVDIISFEVGFERNPNLHNAIRTYTKQIGQKFTEYSQKDRKNRIQENTKAFDQMNEDVANITADLDNFLQQLDIPIEELFIYHESLKLYASAESNDKFNGFHGREMTILNYIDELYSLAGIAGLQLPQRDAITFLAANLSKLAVGYDVVEPLEKYFSLFAGLIMFDDVRNIALEAAKQLTYSSVKNIHLYNLNGIYVPASMILSYTYQGVVQAAEIMTSGRSATASISTSGANSIISNWLEKNKPKYKGDNFKGEWSPVAEAALKGTKVRISFLASFMDFLQELMS